MILLLLLLLLRRLLSLAVFPILPPFFPICRRSNLFMLLDDQHTRYNLFESWTHMASMFGWCEPCVCVVAHPFTTSHRDVGKYGGAWGRNAGKTARLGGGLLFSVSGKTSDLLLRSIRRHQTPSQTITHHLSPSAISVSKSTRDKPQPLQLLALGN